MDYDNLGICETCGDRYVLRPATVCSQCAAQRTIDDDVPTGDDATPFTLTTDSDEQ